MSAGEIVIVVLLVIIASSFISLSALLMLLRRTPFFWREGWLRYSLFFSPPLLEIIARAERDLGVRLTWGAREMLIIPVLETLEREGSVDWHEVDSSIRVIVSTIAEHRQPEHERGKARNSISVIRGFFQRFCNIPPFCSRKEG